MAKALKVQRLEARVTFEVKHLIERAAQLRGTSVTDFLVSSAQQAATDAIRDSEQLRLRNEARDVFLNALMRPPAPNAAARAAAARYKKRLGPRYKGL